MRIRKVVRTKKPLEKVFAYFSDFTTTTLWDPGTVVTVRIKGEGSVGTEYLNTSTFAGRKTQLTYVVQEFVQDQRISLRGENKTVVAIDTITFRKSGGETEVTYTAEFTFKDRARFIAPFLKTAFAKLGRKAKEGMERALKDL